MPELSLHLSALPAAQRRLWREFSALPPSFVLYGGTAAALHLGHRHSVDFDFFANRALDLPALEAGIPFLAGAGVVQREPNTLSVIVDRGGPVKVSFFGVPKLPRLEPPSFPRSRSRPCRTSGDGDLRTLPEDVKARLVTAAREVDLERLPTLSLTAGRSHPDTDLGL